MKKWIYTIAGALFVLYGCATSNALKTTAISERNVDNLTRLNLGMSESQVLGIMKDPYKDESIEISEDQYDIWFYVTQPTVLGQTRMVPFNLTPLIFRNKILVGTGYGYYNWLKERSVEIKKSALTPQQRKVKESFQKSTSGNGSRKELSMCSPKSTKEELADPPPPVPEPLPPKNPPKKDIEINDKDQQMIQDEQDQNFNFW